MLKKRVIFTLLHDKGSFVLSRNFRLQKVGSIDWLKRNYNFDKISFFIDELVILDVTRTGKDIEQFSGIVREISRRVFVPLAAGGGVDSVQNAQKLLRSGADKIVVNTNLSCNGTAVPGLVSEFGSQCIIAAVDAKKESEVYRVYSENGSRLEEPFLGRHLESVADLGVGEIYLNSIERDGTGMGYDFGMLEELPVGFNLPVILAGGVGNESHLASGLADLRVDAVATAHLFNFVGDGLRRAREKLVERGYKLAKWPNIDEITGLVV